MIVNGYIYAQVSAGTGLDTNGDPISATPVWGDPIECQINTLNSDVKGKYMDGIFVRSSYEIFIMFQEFDAQIVSIVDDQKGALGEFKVQDIEFLDLVQRVKITV